MLNSVINLVRLNKPIGIWLLLWPCFIGLAVTNCSNIKYYLIFFIGAVFLRSAGCIVNDIFDKDFDKQVNRSRNRPLANNTLSIKQALIILAICMFVGFLIFLQFCEKAKTISLISLPMIIIYPLLKRITYWPQVFLGFTFNMGFLIAVASQNIELNYIHFCIYAALIFWTIFYDTIYAFADIKDDIKANIKSSAIKMQKKPKLYLSLVNFVVFIFLSNAFDKKLFLTIFLLFLYNQILLQNLNHKNENSCIKTFKLCHFFGLSLWIFIELVRIISP